MATLTSSVEPGSWADLVRDVDKSRKMLPWDPNATEPVQRVSKFHRKRLEREVDPVTLKFRDTEKEMEREMNRTQKQLDRAQSVNEARAKAFNIVSHQGPPRRIDTENKMTKYMPDRGYHILSNLQHPDHTFAPTLHNEEYSLTKFKPASIIVKSQINKGREFNIVSNEFKTDAERRRKEDYEQMKQHVLKKYWETHDYDPIKVSYYNNDKEQQYQQQKQVLQEVQGRSIRDKIPPSLKYSEGHNYNILTHNSFEENADEPQNNTLLIDRSMNRVKKREVEAMHRTMGEIQSTTQEELHRNRYNFKRWETQIDRGYHIVTNEPVTQPPLPAVARPQTMWNRLQTSNSSPIRKLNAARATLSSAHGNIMHNTMSTQDFKDQLQSVQSVDDSDGLVGGYFVGAGARLRNLSGNNSNNNTNTNSNDASTTSLSTSQSNNQLPTNAQYSRANSYSHSINNNNVQTQSNNNIKPQSQGIASGSTSRRPPPPSLDLTRNQFAEPVIYQEPSNGPPGLAVPIVRTGGFSVR